MEPEEPKIDWFIFTTTGIVIAVVTLLLLLAPQASQEAITRTFSFITGKTGLLYIWFGIGVMFFSAAHCTWTIRVHHAWTIK
jgi:choline-glycine betaine transporter